MTTHTPAPRTPYGNLAGQAAAGFARFASSYRLTAPQAQELAELVWRWAGQAPEPSPVAGDCGPYCWIRGNMAQALARRGVLWRPRGWRYTWHPEALAILQELAQAQADAEAQAAPAPVTEAQEDLALALASEGLSPEALQEAQEDLALAMAWEDPAHTPGPAPWGDAWAQDALEALQDLRPCLPGEALPPEPPAWAGPAPELPPVPTPWHRLTPGQAEAAWQTMLTRAVARQKGAL